MTLMSCTPRPLSRMQNAIAAASSSSRTDPSEQYLSEIDRAISRAQRAAEEEAREAERAANPEPAATEEEAAPEEEEWL